MMACVIPFIVPLGKQITNKCVRRTQTFPSRKVCLCSQFICTVPSPMVLLSFCLLVYMYIYMISSVCLFVGRFVCLSVCGLLTISFFRLSPICWSLYVCLSVCLTVCLSVCLSMDHQTFLLAVCRSFRLPVCWSFCPSVCLSFRVCVRPSVRYFVCLSVCLSYGIAITCKYNKIKDNKHPIELFCSKHKLPYYGSVQRPIKNIPLFGRIRKSFERISLSFEQLKDSFERKSLSFEQIKDSFERISLSFEQIKDPLDELKNCSNK